MDPQAQFCPDPQCPTGGQTARGNIKVHSYRERRYRCTTCRKTFAAATGTPFYRLHKDPSLFVGVAPLLASGCPTQAVVATFGLDERTVADWQDREDPPSSGLRTRTSWSGAPTTSTCPDSS